MYNFSVIIPYFNDYSRLLLCLDASAKQEHPTDQFEVIVVNNDPDSSLSVPNEFFGKLNLIILNEPVPGSYAARNAGIVEARGKILAFTDSDCIPEPDWLANALRYFDMDDDKSLGILAGDVPLFYKDPNDLSYAEIYEKYTGFTFEAYVRDGNCGAGNWFSYPEVMREFGGFNPRLKSNGDTELSGRISKKYRVVFAPDVVVRHPARFYVKDIVFKYRRLVGGTYTRRYIGKPLSFFKYIVNFTFRRFRFSLKKFFTVPPQESWAIFVVCMAITLGVWKEYIYLLQGGDTKR